MAELALPLLESLPELSTISDGAEESQNLTKLNSISTQTPGVNSRALSNPNNLAIDPSIGNNMSSSAGIPIHQQPSMFSNPSADPITAGIQGINQGSQALINQGFAYGQEQLRQQGMTTRAGIQARADMATSRTQALGAALANSRIQNVTPGLQQSQAISQYFANNFGAQNVHDTNAFLAAAFNAPSSESFSNFANISYRL